MQKINKKNICTCPNCNEMWLFDPEDVVDSFIGFLWWKDRNFPGISRRFSPYFCKDRWKTDVERLDKHNNKILYYRVKENPDLQYYYIECGSCFVSAFNSEDEYTVIVTNDYYEYEEDNEE